MSQAQEPRRDEAQALRDEIADLRARLPKHSIPPTMLQELEELEERMAGLERDEPAEGSQTASGDHSKSPNS